MVLTFLEKACLWIFRLIQWCLAVALLGITGNFVTEFNQADHQKTPPEVWLPCIASAFAICISFYSILLLYCLGRLLLHIAAFFDFCFLIVYIVAIVLNRHNFSADGTQNQLWQKLVTARSNADIDPEAAKNETLVKAMVGLTVTMMVLFVITTLMSINLAQRADDKKDSKRRRRSSSSRRRSAV